MTTFYGEFEGRDAIADMLEKRFWRDADGFRWCFEDICEAGDNRLRVLAVRLPLAAGGRRRAPGGRGGHVALPPPGRADRALRRTARHRRGTRPGSISCPSAPPASPPATPAHTGTGPSAKASGTETGQSRTRHPREASSSPVSRRRENMSCPRASRANRGPGTRANRRRDNGTEWERNEMKKR